ncbi:MAG: GtrA family protein [Anaerolineae bacterium]|nr:GtrA family protein [Anaerolineae bacterium]
MTRTASGETPMPPKRKGRSIRTPLDGVIVAVARRFGGSRAKDLERFLKFAIVGTIGAIVDFGTLNLLIHTILPPVDAAGNPLGLLIPIGEGFLFENVGIATTVAFVAAVLSNFVWNRLWTYPDSRSRSMRRQLVQFGIVSVVGWLARLVWIKWSYLKFAGLVTLASTGVAATTPDPAAVNIGANIAQLIAVFVVMIWNFFANRYWTYNDVDRGHHSH